MDPFDDPQKYFTWLGMHREGVSWYNEIMSLGYEDKDLGGVLSLLSSMETNMISMGDFLNALFEPRMDGI